MKVHIYISYIVYIARSDSHWQEVLVAVFLNIALSSDVFLCLIGLHLCFYVIMKVENTAMNPAKCE